MEYFGTVCLPICFSIMRRVLWVRATRTLIQCSDYDTRCAHEFREAPGVRCFSTAFEKQIGSLCRATPDDRGARSIHLTRRSATKMRYGMARRFVERPETEMASRSMAE